MKAWRPGEPVPAEERPEFLDQEGELLCAIHHASAEAKAKGTVVLAGPMTLERSHGYLTWVRWARTLAVNGYHTWRFDYRGVGESTGRFSEQTFDGWQRDLEAVVARARARCGGPVVLLGLRLGALLARAVLGTGAVDALLAWDPPATARQMLMDMLRRKLAADYMELPDAPRRTRDEYVRDLERGEVVEVEGYHWSRGLWTSAASYSFSDPPPAEGRPPNFQVVWLDGRSPDRLTSPRHASAKIPRPAFWLQSSHLVAELDDLFALTLAGLEEMTGQAAPRAPAVVDHAPGIAATTGPRRGRRLDVVDLPAGRCVGTVHQPAGSPRRVGLLWINFGYVPRDGHGGLAAQVSDELAGAGVPCYRYDLPGLGDAPGPLPPETLAFFPVVTGGDFAVVTSQLVRHLCERDGLEALVLGGLCGGAVTAIFAADTEPARVKGLVLLEPEMYLTEPKGDEPAQRQRAREWLRSRLPTHKGAATALLDRALAIRWPYEEELRAEVERRLPLRALRSKVFSYWGWMRLLTSENRYARYVPLPRKAILDFVLSRSELPAVTNLQLATAWRRWVEARRPVLIVTAEGKLREVFFDRINATVLEGLEKERYQHVRLRNTNHIFTTGGAIATVTSHVKAGWNLFA